jgi:hypothetical protein
VVEGQRVEQARELEVPGVAAAAAEEVRQVLNLLDEQGLEAGHESWQVAGAEHFGEEHVLAGEEVLLLLLVLVLVLVAGAGAEHSGEGGHALVGGEEPLLMWELVSVEMGVEEHEKAEVEEEWQL